MSLSRRLRYLTACGVLIACGGIAGTPESEGVSSFLNHCTETCADGLECIGEICTRACGMGEASCAELLAGAVCVDQGFCDVNCSNAEDCAWLGAGFECAGAFCREAGLSEPPIDAGPPPDEPPDDLPPDDLPPDVVGGDNGGPIDVIVVIDADSLLIDDIAVGNGGDLAIVGAYEGTVDVGGSSWLPPSAGGLNGYAATFDATGNPLWATSVATGDGAHLYSMVFDDVVTATGSSPTSLLRFDDAGSVEWSKTFDGSVVADEYADIASSAGGEIVAVGRIATETDFGGGTVSPSHQGGNAYAASYDAGGNWKWDTYFPSSLPSSDSYPQDVIVDSAGNTVTVGWFFHEIDFGEGPVEADGDGNVYLTKFDAAGALLFARTFGSGPEAILAAPDLAVTSDGDIVLLGGLFAAFDFGTGPVGPGGLVVARFDPQGNARWVQTVTASEGNLIAGGVAIDSVDEIVIAGAFSGTLDTPTASSAESGLDAIVIKLDGNGDYVWERVIGGPGDQEIVAIDIDADDNIFVGGAFARALDVGTSEYSASTEYGNIFIATLTP